MSKVPNGRYTKEFREEAVKMVVTGGHSAGSAARRLSLPTSTLENWVRAHRAGKLGDIGKQAKPLTETELELARVKRELAEVKMERDILKKPQRILQKSRCQIRDDCGYATRVSDPNAVQSN